MKFLKYIFYILIITQLFTCKENNTHSQAQSNTKPEVLNEFKKDSIDCKKTVKNYFHLINQSKFKEAINIFADKVDQFITVKNTNPNQIFQLTSQFLKDKKPINYKVYDSIFTCKNNIATFVLNMEWSIPVSEEWKNKNGYTNGADRTRSTDVKIEIIFNDKNKITSYKEIQIFRKKYKTLVELDAFPKLDFDETNVVKIPKNSILMDDFEKISLMSSVSFAVLHKIVYNGKSYWITDSDSYKSSAINNGEKPTVNKLIEEIK